MNLFTKRIGKQTVVVFNPQKLVRETWAFCINSDPRFIVVDEAGSLDELMEIIKTKKPRVVLVTLEINLAGNIELARLIHHYSPRTRIIAIYINGVPFLVNRLLQQGFMGYLTHNSSLDEIMMSVHEVCVGRKYICNEAKDYILKELETKVKEDLQ